MTGILLCWLTRFMFEREQRAILQWPFMPCEKYTSLLVRLMKALSCPPHPNPHPTHQHHQWKCIEMHCLGPAAQCVGLRFLFFLKASGNNLRCWCKFAPPRKLAEVSPRCYLMPRHPPHNSPSSPVSQTVIKAPQNEGLSRKEDRGEGKIRRDR